MDNSFNRGLDRNQMERLASLDFICGGRVYLSQVRPEQGKSYIATAIGYQACKEGIRTSYANASKQALRGALKAAKTKGTLEAELKNSNDALCSFLTTSFLCLSIPRRGPSCSTSSRIGMGENRSSSPRNCR